MPYKYPSQMTPEEFRALRKHLNLSQERFARLLGVSFSTVSRWENGSRVISDIAAQGILSAVAEELRRRGKISDAIREILQETPA